MDSRKTLLQRLKGGQCASKVKTPQTFTGKLFVSKYWNRRLKVNFIQNFCGEAKQAKNEFKKTVFFSVHRTAFATVGINI